MRWSGLLEALRFIRMFRVLLALIRWYDPVWGGLDPSTEEEMIQILPPVSEEGETTISM